MVVIEEQRKLPSVCLCVCMRVPVCVHVCLPVCTCVRVYVCCRFDRELDDVMREMKKGGVLEFRRKPVPPLSTLKAIDSRQWQGLNTSYLHARYPRQWLVFTYLLYHNVFCCVVKGCGL